MDRKLTRIMLLIIMITGSTFIGGIFAFKTTTSSFHNNSIIRSKLDNDEMNQVIPQNYSRIGIRGIQGCCGHTDVTPPSITLTSPRNNTVILNGTIIVLEITDDYKLNQVRYHWDNDQSNTTIDEPPYEIVLPNDTGQHIIYVYAEDSEGNWVSTLFIFTVTTDPSSTTPSSPYTGLSRHTPGFLLLPVIMVLIGLVTIITWRRRKQEF